MPEFGIRIRAPIGRTAEPDEQTLELFEYLESGAVRPRGILTVPRAWLAGLQQAGQLLELLAEGKLTVAWYEGGAADRLALAAPDPKLAKALRLARKLL